MYVITCLQCWCCILQAQRQHEAAIHGQTAQPQVSYPQQQPPLVYPQQSAAGGAVAMYPSLQGEYMGMQLSPETRQQYQQYQVVPHVSSHSQYPPRFAITSWLWSSTLKDISLSSDLVNGKHSLRTTSCLIRLYTTIFYWSLFREKLVTVLSCWHIWNCVKQLSKENQMSDRIMTKFVGTNSVSAACH